jgi:hypothetical protein
MVGEAEIGIQLFSFYEESSAVCLPLICSHCAGFRWCFSDLPVAAADWLW